MSVATEGVEMSIGVTRETRQAHKIRQICEKIDELLQKQDKKEKQDVVKITLPYDMNEVGANVLEAIHAQYAQYLSERVGNDLFIKYDGIRKERVHRRLANSCEAFNPHWCVETNPICIVRGTERRPDVGVWFTGPTGLEGFKPVVNQCPPPDVWIEVFFNRDPDRSNAITKINFVNQHYSRKEFVGIAIPDYIIDPNPNPGRLANPGRFTNPGRFSNPGRFTNPATPETNQNNRPTHVPYAIHWDANHTPVYYRIYWNEHIVLRCGWILEFNIVLDALT